MFRTLLRACTYVLSTISPVASSKFYYRVKLRKKLNLQNPRTFNEKLMALKLLTYEKDDLITKCADKFLVREYVRESECEELLNGLIGVYETSDEIDFTKLPNSFVLKCNHAAGYNLVCKDKKSLNITKTKKQFNKWLKIDYWKFVAELQYKNINKKIVCENYLFNEDGSSLNDYKIYCFDGVPLFCMVCVDRDSKDPKYYFMDKEWKILKINRRSLSLSDDFSIEKPKNMDLMYEYAEKLSKPFKFVRVDLYDVNDKVYFGELTFTPAGCVDDNYTEQGQEWLGSLINLEDI